MSRSVYIVAIENSADHLGAELASELRKSSPELRLAGIGGPAMRTVGIPSQMDIAGMAILGFVEGLRAYPMILRKVREATERVMASRSDAVVLIDSWGFMVRVAKRLKALGYQGQVIKYVAPQVWAMREGRAKILAQHVDHLLTIHSFDAPYFTRHGLPVHHVGNPVFDADYTQGDGRALRAEYDLGDRSVVAVFFGSRQSEIARLCGPFADALAILRDRFPDVVFVSPVSQSVAKDVAAAAGGDQRLQDVILLPEARKFDVMSAAKVAMACSGTVTTQLACAGIPTVVAYKLAPSTFHIAKLIFKQNYISIVNIAANAPLMPEFIQHQVTGVALASAVADYLLDAEHEKNASLALLSQTNKMRGADGNSSARAANVILQIIA